MLKNAAIAALLLAFAGASPEPDANGVRHVCISNDGECQAAEIKVLTDYLGSSTAATQTFASRIGEWGRLSMPNSPQPLLVNVC